MKNNVLYGIPYMGSKTAIAPNILKQLPSGTRFVDLFGGGFAMSHAAVLSRKYEQVLYNDFNPLVVNLIKRALNGEFNYKTFKPEFITKQMFEARKNIDGYVKYIWSFGNDGQHYMFGEETEPLKHSAHDFVVFGKWDGKLNEGFRKAVKSKDIHNRRMEFCGYARKIKKRFDLQQLEQLQRLERLQQLQRLEQLERLQQLQQLQRLERLQQLQQLERLERLQPSILITNGSYIDYKYKDGDVVYCDPPYENTSSYGSAFDHKQFYEWAYSRDYPVYFSSYKISDKRFKVVYAKRKRTTRGGAKDCYNFECLYYNGK